MKMPAPISPGSLTDGFDAIRTEFEIPRSFPPAVLSEAHAAVARTVPTALNVPFVAVDPAGATDLDQAVHIETRGAGFRVRYAISDPAQFIEPSGMISAEAWNRGVTIYAPDKRTPLHPRVLSEERASLLPDGVSRPAMVWTFDLDSDGRVVDSHLQRQTVEIAEAISYHEAQRRIDDGEVGTLALLEAVGRLRLEIEAERGGVSLNLPSQEVTQSPAGYRLGFETTLSVERWNAQISLMTGMVAGQTMASAGVGILRTLPEPRPSDIASLRVHAAALGIDWPQQLRYSEFIRGLSPEQPNQTALLYAAARTLRGAGYQHLTAGDEPVGHGAIQALYSHVTAPLRRLVDRYANEILHALYNDLPIPAWATESLDAMPSTMQRARALQSSVDRAVVDYLEAVVLTPAIGETFVGVVVKRDPDDPTASVQINDPAVVAQVKLPAAVRVSDAVELRLASADPVERTLDFVLK